MTLIHKNSSNLKYILFNISFLVLFIPVKFFIFLFLSIILVTKYDKAVSLLRNLILPIILILLGALYSVINGNEPVYILHQSRDIFITIYVLCSLICMTRIVGMEKTIDTLIKCCVFIGVLKIIIIILAFVNSEPPSIIIKSITDATGIELMTYDVEGSNISRIQFPIDLVSCFMIFFQLKDNAQNTKLISTIKTFIITLSLLLTMSRIFWFISFFMFLLFMMNNVSGKKNLKFKLIIIFLFTMSIGIFYDQFSDIISSRIGGNAAGNYASDLTREFQNNMIFNTISKAPLLGQGLGYYLPQMIRSTTEKYAYESQLYALIMQVGLLGTLLLFFNILLIIYVNANLKYISNIFCSVAVLVLWCLSGTFNPLLFNVSAGVVLFISYLFILKEERLYV